MVRAVKDMAALSFWPRSSSPTWLIYVLCEENNLENLVRCLILWFSLEDFVLNCSKPGMLKLLANLVFFFCS